MRNVLFAAAGVVLTALLIFGIFWSTHNNAVQTENQIKATADDGETVIAQFYLSLDETVQVTEMYSDDFREAMGEMIRGRYGEDGNQSMFSLIREEMPELDPGMYQRVQDLITSSRGQYALIQRRLRDQRRQYENQLDSLGSGMILSWMGFPRMDMDDPRWQPTSTQAARDMRETGMEEARQIGGS
tara:strand:+ start:3166 stop:3723 length:558 start_codon:yes stop_codon:yes gene_type:complete